MSQEETHVASKSQQLAMTTSVVTGSIASSISLAGTVAPMFSPLAFPPSGADILQQSVESQRESVLAFYLRDSENIEALRMKKARRQLLRSQIERREEMDRADQMASEFTTELLEHLAIAVRDRQTPLRTEGYQTFVFDNGDVYEGNWKSCRMHGTGCLKRSVANDLYEGEWFLGMRSGTGMCYSADFDTFYSGKWQDGKRHGRGELVELEGVFVGEFVDGRIQGYGEYVYNDGHVYKGDWVNGVYEGSGLYLLPGGQKYEGQWVNGFEHGRGTMTYPNGDTYTGEWRHGRKHGVGSYTSAFLQYEGEWRHGAIHGRGQCRYADGSTYDGDWVNGMYHGTGTFVGQTHRQSYVGEFRNGKRSGKGVYSSDDVEYNGEWLDDKKHGVGEMRTRGGGTLYGTWRHDVPHGDGTYVSNGENVYVTYDSGMCAVASPQELYKQVNLRLLSKEDKPN